MGELEHIPIQPKETNKADDQISEGVGEDLPEGDFDIPMDRVGERASENWSSGFTQAQQFIQAIRSEEAKQHKKEEELAQMLRTYIQQMDNEDLFTTLLALLERNVLASILVAALTLRDKSLTSKITSQLPSGNEAPAIDHHATSRELQAQFGASPWDAAVKPDIETWLYTLRELCAAYPKRLMKDLSAENRGSDEFFAALLQAVLHDFFQQLGKKLDPMQAKHFSEAVVQRLIEQMIDQVENQKSIQ